MLIFWTGNKILALICAIVYGACAAVFAVLALIIGDLGFIPSLVAVGLCLLSSVNYLVFRGREKKNQG